MSDKDTREVDKEKGLKEQDRQKKKKWWIVLVVILAVLAVAVISVYAVVKHYYSKSNYVKDSDVTVAESVETESTGLTEEETNALEAETADILDDITLPNDKNVYNILLVGVDRRDKSWNGNSDSMILVSINKDTKKIHMTSFMRDLYASIPGKGVHKLNASCAYGGGPLVVRTIEDNYKIPIDNYASVDFDAMIDIVDLVGGVTIDISDAEVEVANNYVTEMCKLREEDPAKHYISNGGEQLLDGYQAVAYARIRYVGNSDYQRTERQREVLTKIMEKAKGLSIGELNTLANRLLPMVTHNIDEGMMLTLLTEVPTFLSYENVQSRVPYDGMFSSKGEMLVPDFASTIKKLQTDIYGDSAVE